MFNIDWSKAADLFRYHSESPLLFSSGLFLFLFLGFVLVYRGLINHNRARILWATAFSVFFYFKSSGIYFLLLVGSVVVDYNLARWIEQASTQRARKWLLVLSLVANLGLLAYFKYTNYFATLWNGLSGGSLGPFDIFLPVGISFFTFQSLSYTIDVYRGQLKALDNILDYTFFVTFFPQMVAGPIVRASDFLPQINEPLHVSRNQFGRGVFLICCGLFKKAVISDYISLNFVDRIFDAPERFSGLENLVGVYGYALQIYCDFSGYSDMAIGLGLLLGFRFPINFDAPYTSLSITEFWRRWHISLSTWLRDYLYIPLGGNRKGKFRTYVNLMITMLLGGLWHGAATKFVIWGGLHGFALAVERWWKNIYPYHPGRFRKFLGWVLSFHFVCLCWILFRAADMATVLAILNQIVTAFQPQLLGEFVQSYKVVLGFMVVGYVLHFTPVRWDKAVQRGVTALPLAGKALLITAMAALVMQVKSADVQPFLPASPWRPW